MFFPPLSFFLCVLHQLHRRLPQRPVVLPRGAHSLGVAEGVSFTPAKADLARKQVRRHCSQRKWRLHGRKRTPSARAVGMSGDPASPLSSFSPCLCGGATACAQKTRPLQQKRADKRLFATRALSPSTTCQPPAAHLRDADPRCTVLLYAAAPRDAIESLHTVDFAFCGKDILRFHSPLSLEFTLARLA